MPSASCSNAWSPPTRGRGLKPSTGSAGLPAAGSPPTRVPGPGRPGGCPPRPPTEPDVPVKGIRLVTLWRCPSHVPSPYQDTLVRLGVLGVGLASGPQRGTPFAPQGPVGPVPPLRRYYGALRLPDSLLAALRFLRLAIPWSVCISSPFGRRRVANGSSRSLLYRLLPIRFSSGNCQDLPRSRKTRAIIRHVPPTPV